jgi:hypothetical protein
LEPGHQQLWFVSFCISHQPGPGIDGQERMVLVHHEVPLLKIHVQDCFTAHSVARMAVDLLMQLWCRSEETDVIFLV